VSVVDSGKPFPRTGETLVTITVEDVNDKSPTFQKVCFVGKQDEIDIKKCLFETHMYFIPCTSVTYIYLGVQLGGTDLHSRVITILYICTTILSKSFF
jgi:hypothetical protein